MSKYPGRIVTDLAPAGYSVSFDGTGDYLSAAANTALTFGTGDFTVEGWFYANALGGQPTILNNGSDAGGLVITMFSSKIYAYFVGAGNVFGSGGATLATNTWYHFAWVRSGSTHTFYLNGAVYGATYSSAGNHASTGGVGIGYSVAGTAFAAWNGYIANVRMVKGTALYTAAFTPPTQLLNITNTSLLTCNSPALVDQSTNAFAITANGNAAVSTLTPFTAYVPYNPALGASTPGVWTVDEAMQAAATRQWNMYDPYFNLTTLLLRSGSTDGSQNKTFQDSSSNNFSITPNGNTTQGTFTPFSQTGWSNYFGGDGNYLSTAYSADFSFSTGEFSIECWAYVQDAGRTADANKYGALISQAVAASTTNQWQFLIRIVSGVITEVVLEVNGASALSVTGQSISINAWHHFVLCRSGTTLSIFVDGTRIGTITYSTAINSNTSGTLQIARNAYANTYQNWLSGYISNVRILNGTSAYSASVSTFTVPASPITDVTNTKLLTCQSNRFIDANTQVTAKTITITGTPSVQPFSPFLPTRAYTPQTIGGSGYFDGSGDYLTVADNPALEPVGNNFCIEISYYPTSVSGNRVLIGKRVNPSTDYGFLIFLSGATVLTYISSANSSYDIANGNNIGTLVNNQWHHIAIFRVGNAWYASLNGAITTLASNNSLSVNNNAGNWAIGADSTGGTVVQGFISNVRFVIGSSVYTSTSAPFPTAPLTAITNTQLLLNYTNAAITDATSKSVLETVGNAQASTSVRNTRLVTTPPSAVYLDGSGDAVAAYSPTPVIATLGDFTAEAWVYVTSASDNTVFYLNGNTTSYAGCRMGINGNQAYLLISTSGSSWAINSGNISSVPSNTWHHLAVVRSGGTFYLFLNGTSIFTSTSVTATTALMSGSINLVGALNSSGISGSLNGYIDDARVTRFARYTAAFTPPRSRLQEQ